MNERMCDCGTQHLPPEPDPMVRIADALEGLLTLYKAHLRLTAQSARTALVGSAPPDVWRLVEPILRELEEVAR